VKCDQCDNPATVREITRVNGVKFERHLCEACAAKQGIGLTPAASTESVLKATVMVTGATRSQVCPSCRLSFGEFKQHGLLGCSECYRVFEPQLGPLIERAHQGGLKHQGKQPKRQCGTSTHLDLEARAQRLRRIRDELESAVREEQYERAARLRDELKKLGEGGGTP